MSSILLPLALNCYHLWQIVDSNDLHCALNEMEISLIETSVFDQNVHSFYISTFAVSQSEAALLNKN